MNELIPSTGMMNNNVLSTVQNKTVVHQEFNEYPNDIYYDEINPMLTSPNSQFDLPFYQTKETLVDPETYKSFLNNAISRFRRSREYKNYKAYLMGLGLDHSEELGNISSEIIGEGGIEMHHNFITIFDIAMMICEHILNTVGVITTFDLITLLKIEHTSNNIPIVMLDETSHEVFHDDQNYYIPMDRVWGSWWVLFDKYRYGITMDIAYKVIKYINWNDQYFKAKGNDAYSKNLFKLRDELNDWSVYNEYGYQYNYAGYINNPVSSLPVNNNLFNSNEEFEKTIFET